MEKYTNNKEQKNKKQSNLLLAAGAIVLLAAVIIGALLIPRLSSDKDVSQSTGTEEITAVSSHEMQRQESETELESEVISSETKSVKESQTEEVVPSQVRLMAVGDNLMHRSYSLSGQQPDGSWNYTRNFEHISPVIQQADLAVINQETVMGGLDLGIQNYPTLNTGVEVGSFLIQAGFDVVLAANNHILDQDFIGVQNMMNFWKTSYPQIPLLGIHQNQAERDTITVVEKNGIRIAMLNYTYDTNIRDAVQGRPYLVDYLDRDFMAADIAKAKQQADFVIVFPHWGEEYRMDVNEQQQELTQFFAEQGVDLVIGSHPHVVEPVRWVSREGDNPMLVYYSLGNFQSIQYRTETMMGGLADVTIVKDQNGTYIANHKLDCLVTHFQNTNPDLGYFDFVTTYRWDEYTPELAAQHAVQYEDSTFSYEALASLRQRVMDMTE